MKTHRTNPHSPRPSQAKAKRPAGKGKLQWPKAARRFSHQRSVPDDPSQPIMISCFDKSTIMAQPWADAGYLAYCVDLQHPRGESRVGNIVKVGANMLDFLPPKGDIRFAAFFVPCTDTAVSGAQWFKEKGLGALGRTIDLFKRSVDLAEMIGCPYLIEHPRSVVSTHWRGPDYSFHPFEYGDDHLKETMLWVGGGFRMPRKTPVKPIRGMKLYWLPPSPERANLRSETPAGFAAAVFRANHARTEK